MKKILTVVFLIALSISAFGQARARNGISIGDHKVSGTHIKVVDSLTVNNTTTPTLFKVYSGATQLNPDVPSTHYIDNATVFVKLLQDTVSFTAETKTLALTDAGKIVYCSNADFQEITIPANGTVAFPVGTIITFINNGPGIVRLTPAATVVRKSVLDSTTMNTVNQTYQIIKRATNKWYFIGDFKD